MSAVPMVVEELGQKVEATPTGLVFHGELSYQEWTLLGCQLAKLRRSIHWLIGDWLNYGERRFGEQYAQAMADTGFDYQTLANDKWVASRISPARRREELSFSHHLAVARLEPVEQEAWLVASEQRGLTRDELREVLRTPEDGPRLPSVHERLRRAEWWARAWARSARKWRREAKGVPGA